MPRKRDRVTIRLRPGKEHVYAKFKDIVVNKQNSDVCFVLTSLMETYTLAMQAAESQKPHEPVMLQFPKQNVQINMGCTINYNVEKPRRRPLPTHDKRLLDLDKNRFLPLLLEEWPTMNMQAKQFWRSRLHEAGIIDCAACEWFMFLRTVVRRRV